MICIMEREDYQKCYNTNRNVFNYRNHFLIEMFDSSNIMTLLEIVVCVYSIKWKKIKF
jgi:hypothetical protein